MTEKRFHYDWKTGRFKDTLSNSCATSNMRVLETQINGACYNYEKKIKELEKENQDNKAMIEFLSTENTQIMNELKTRTQIQHQLAEENMMLKGENAHYKLVLMSLKETARKFCEISKVKK